jgi:hypothetical protein
MAQIARGIHHWQNLKWAAENAAQQYRLTFAAPVTALGDPAMFFVSGTHGRLSVHVIDEDRLELLLQSPAGRNRGLSDSKAGYIFDITSETIEKAVALVAHPWALLEAQMSSWNDIGNINEPGEMFEDMDPVVQHIYVQHIVEPGSVNLEQAALRMTGKRLPKMINFEEVCARVNRMVDEQGHITMGEGYGYDEMRTFFEAKKETGT